MQVTCLRPASQVIRHIVMTSVTKENHQPGGKWWCSTELWKQSSKDHIFKNLHKIYMDIKIHYSAILRLKWISFSPERITGTFMMVGRNDFFVIVATILHNFKLVLTIAMCADRAISCYWFRHLWTSTLVRSDLSFYRKCINKENILFEDFLKKSYHTEHYEHNCSWRR